MHGYKVQNVLINPNRQLKDVASQSELCNFSHVIGRESKEND